MTIFSKMINGDIAVSKVLETDRLIVIHDINPQAPVHLLIITKTPYGSLQSIPSSDLNILQEVGELVQMLAKQFNIENNYRFVTNIGTLAGQSIFHLHFHLLGGSKFSAIV